MRRSTRLQLLAVTLILVVVLSACTGGGSTMYEAPIGAEGGWGWLQWIISQVANFTFWVSSVTGGFFWIGLIIVTIIVRSAGWPIYSKSNAMTTNMQQAQPDLDAMKEKYKGRTDEASQKKMQAETMEIYKKYGINPLGCLLPFLQMPIFIAMYQVVRRMPLSNGTLEGFGADVQTTAAHIADYRDTLDFGFLWIKDLGQADPYYILPILVGLLMFFYQRYSMKKPDYLQNKKFQKNAQQKQSENTMKIMSYFMVIMLVSIALTNAGIALYWVVGNSFQFLQTYINRKQNYKKFAASKEY